MNTELDLLCKQHTVYIELFVVMLEFLKMIYVGLPLITTFEVFRVSDHMFQISHSLVCLSQVWMVTFGGVLLNMA